VKPPLIPTVSFTICTQANELGIPIEGECIISKFGLEGPRNRHSITQFNSGGFIFRVHAERGNVSEVLKVPNPFPNSGEPGRYVNDIRCEQHSTFTWGLVTDDGPICRPFAPA
jgi:hypothetical protein